MTLMFGSLSSSPGLGLSTALGLYLNSTVMALVNSGHVSLLQLILSGNSLPDILGSLFLW